jgi:SAM-dependent methyltransferase
MHLTRYTMYQRIGAAIGHQLRGKILGISGIENFERWIDRPNSRVVDVWYPLVDMQKLPFQAEEFDVVISDQVISNVRNPFGAVQESFRVLKKGGLAIHTSCFWNPILNYPKDYFRFSPDGLRALCPENVEIVECGGWGNRLAMMLMLIRDPFFRFMQIPDRPGLRRWLATYNDERYPMLTWIVARKCAGA